VCLCVCPCVSTCACVCTRPAFLAYMVLDTGDEALSVVGPQSIHSALAVWYKPCVYMFVKVMHAREIMATLCCVPFDSELYL
jgi:hypothetical protein